MGWSGIGLTTKNIIMLMTVLLMIILVTVIFFSIRKGRTGSATIDSHAMHTTKKTALATNSPTITGSDQSYAPSPTIEVLSVRARRAHPVQPARRNEPRKSMRESAWRAVCFVSGVVELAVAGLG